MNDFGLQQKKIRYKERRGREQRKQKKAAPHRSLTHLQHQLANQLRPIHMLVLASFAHLVLS
jgi:hypothetical protein